MNDQSVALADDLDVLIGGGGIGGLYLAQGLKKSGVSVSVYERDVSAQVRSQGYRIHINSDDSYALRECLPQHLFMLYVATSMPDRGGRRVTFDPQLTEVLSVPLPVSAERGISRISTAVNRLTLREILLAGLEDVVHFDKAFEGFEQLEDGRTRAYFSDGSSATGALVVGADGTNSSVRKLVRRTQGFVPWVTAFTAGRRSPPTPLHWVPESFLNLLAESCRLGWDQHDGRGIYQATRVLGGDSKICADYPSHRYARLSDVDPESVLELKSSNFGTPTQRFCMPRQ